MEQNEKLLKDYSETEKGAYLGAIASLATADHSASEEEIEYISHLADSADVSGEQKEAVIQAAKELSGDELTRCLDILKSSDLRFSLITDIISFANSDQNYSTAEKQNIEKIAAYLNINKEQFSVLDEFVKKSADIQVEQQHEVSQPGFLAKLGLQDKFQNAGINWSSVGKGLLGIAGPIMLGRMLSRRGGGGGIIGGGGLGSLIGGSAGGGLGSLLGGSGGGLGSVFGGRSSGGGLGSLISSLSGGRGFSNSGGLLSKVLGGLRL